jgi:hypothetical protein
MITGTFLFRIFGGFLHVLYYTDLLPHWRITNIYLNTMHDLPEFLRNTVPLKSSMVVKSENCFVLFSFRDHTEII